VDTSRLGLRQLAARGVVITAAFQAGYATLGLLQRFAVAAFLTTSEYGLWGIVLLIVTTLSWLKEVGISQKYVQQDDPDQELAFQKAFTLELLYTGVFCLAVLASLPLFGLLYDNSDIVLPAAVLTLTLLGSALQAPIWIAFRGMRYLRQRTLEAINPVLGTVVMIALAAAGAGYWSIVIGLVVGNFAAAAVAIATSPYPLRLRYDHGTLREYVGFSGPLLFAAVAGVVIVQGTMLVGSFEVGLAGLGALTLATSILAYTERLDQLISQTIYPALCAVADRRQLLYEAFEKSNRLALIWGVPFGFATALFADDLVHFVLGDEWDEAIPLLQVLGITSALRQIGFNWGTFFNATGRTMPLAVSAAVLLGVFAVVTVPAIIAWGLDGFIAGACASLVAELIVRSIYLRRMFPGFRLVALAIRAVLPVLPGTAAVLVLRLIESGPREPAYVIVELLAFLACTVAMTLARERPLLAEVFGYLRGTDATSRRDGGEPQPVE
jgi:O-antigen/teichoic acid export membrane protein